MSASKLVTVGVIAYNAEKTILELLESIEQQTYSELELIICDDASTDQTVELSKNWLEKHKNRFRRVVLLPNEKNRGISRQINRMVKFGRGEWVKPIAGDDVLMPSCIEAFMDAVSRDQMVFKMYKSDEYLIDEQSHIIGDNYYETWRLKRFIQKTTQGQYDYILRQDINVSATTFFCRKAFVSVGGADIRIRNIEDTPLNLKFLKNGYRIGYVQKKTVKWRIHNSVSHSTDKVYQEEHLKQVRMMKRLYIYPEISAWKLDYWWDETVQSVMEKTVLRFFNNKKTGAMLMFQTFMYSLMIREWRKRINIFFFKLCRSERNTGRFD